MIRIALAGNPNSGKTTMYNALTGCNEKVGNWAGVTVSKKEHHHRTNHDMMIVDLPGAYSISPYTNEEAVTRDFIQNAKIDVIINIVDATQLSRSLFFSTQLQELGIPMVIAINKSDLASPIDTSALSHHLNCPVIKTISTSKEGLDELIEIALKEASKKTTAISRNFKNSHERYAFIQTIIGEHHSDIDLNNTETKLDEILTNPWFGIPIFIAVMFFVFELSQVYLGPGIADFLVGHLEAFQAMIQSLLHDANPLLNALVVEGMIGGVIAVIGFLPLVMIMYFLLALLEDCGYMSRVAVVLDPIFKRVGLSGKSVIPFVMSIGCAVPGIMASRTIRDEHERKATIMLAPFIPCGAKIPVISLFAGIFFKNASWISTLMYFLSIIIIFIGALCINKINHYKPKKAFFIIELPSYKLPSLQLAFQTMISRGMAYIMKAATIILLCNTCVQIMQSFTIQFQVAPLAKDSILALIASPVAYLLFPIVGVVSWQLAAAAITGFIAKENIVGTLAVCFVGLENLIDLENNILIQGAGNEAASIVAITKVAALAYLMFTLFTPPCFAAIGAMHAELKNKRLLLGAVGLQLGMGYTIAYFVYTIGTLITAPSLLKLPGALFGLFIVGLFIFTLYYYTKKEEVLK